MSLEALAEDLAALSGDPYRFVQYAFPWGESGTELETYTGVEDWQRRVLEDIRDGLLTPNQAIQEATASGHGVGKSALVSWIILWAISTFEDTRGVVTANTETQLKTKTWAELGKWHRLFIARDLFKLTATALFSSERERTWRIDMVPWSERNQEAFAGLHNQGRRIILIMDEASSIPDVIWETAEGALTDSDTQIIWAVFGNPTRNVGRFVECFPGGKHARSWRHHRVDSRTVSFTNKAQIDRWIAVYGEDSDFVRVRVKGTFPRVGMSEFISAAVVAEACAREAVSHLREPLILGVDVARFGDDESVIFFRRGRDARTIPCRVYSGIDTVDLATRVYEAYLETRADAIFVDGGGVGGGVIDNLRRMQVSVFEIQFGSKPQNLGQVHADQGVKYANRRAEMWGAMRNWLTTGALPDDSDLRTQLISPLYALNNVDAIQLERKADMKKRGAASPDRADALALTFALPVAPRPAEGHMPDGRPQVQSEYDPFAPEYMAA